MPLLLGFDTETTSLSAEEGYITEIGLVLFSTEHHQPVKMFGALVQVPVSLSTEITNLTGITNEMLSEFGISQGDALKAILAFAAKAEYLVAHNAPFDRGFLEALCKREGKAMPDKLFVDTRTDLVPEAYLLGKSASLKYLAADHGFVYPAHRAMNDVLAMLQILDKYPIDSILERAKTPNVHVRAIVSFEDKNLAKERGYFWKPERKLWIKPLKLSEVEREKESAPFSVVLMEGAI